MDTWTDIKVYLNGEQITDYYSFIWTDRYNEPGDFELQLPYTDKNVKKFAIDSAVTCNLSRGIMLVEEVTISISFDQGRVLVVKGRSIESILERRVIADSLILDSDDYTENKFINALNEVCMNGFADMVGVMTENNNFSPIGFAAFSGRDLGLDYSKETMLSTDPEDHILNSEVRIEATGKDLLTIFEENCQLMGFGFRLKDGTKIEVYDGVDRSDEIIYSEEDPYNNLSSIEYSTDSKDYRNFAFVHGDEYSEHSDRIVINEVEYRESDLIDDRFVANAVYKNTSNTRLEMRLGPGFGYAQVEYLEAGSSVTLSLKSGDWGKVADKENRWINMYLNGQQVLVKEENTYHSPVANYDPNPNGDEPLYYKAAIGTKAQGLQKRELYYESGLGRGQNLNEKYTQRLRKAGILELTINHGMKNQISCEVMHDTTKMYQQQFDLGDIVGIKISPIIVPGEEGSTEVIDLIKMRVKEYTISHSPSGLDLYPTLELFDPDYWEVINESIKYQDDESVGDSRKIKVNFLFGDGKITSTEGFNIVYGQDEWIPIWPPGYDFDDVENTDCADIIGVYNYQETGDWIVIPDIEPQKENSIFDGWFNGSHKYVQRNPDDYEEEAMNVDADYIPNGFDGEEISYIAGFDLKSFVLTFSKGDHGRFAAPYNNEESIQKEYKYGIMPIPPAVAPVNDEEGKEFVFDGWDPELAVVTEDASYTAKWKEKPIMYNITWDCGSWGKFTDDAHKNQKSYTELIEHGSSLSPPGVEAYNAQSSTGATWEPADPAWSPELPSEALADGRYTAQWKKKDVDEEEQDPDDEGPDYDGEKIVIDDKIAKTDDKNKTELPSLLLKHLKSYACKGIYYYIDLDPDIGAGESKKDKYNLINPSNPEDLVDGGGISEQVYQEGDYWVKTSPTAFASSPQLIKDGANQYFEHDVTFDLNKWWLVVRFINPPAPRAKGFVGSSIGNNVLNTASGESPSIFTPAFTMALYQKIEGSDDLGGCIGMWWWRFGNGANVAEVAFSTVPIFLPYRDYFLMENNKNGIGLLFVPGRYYVRYTQWSYGTPYYRYERIWTKPSWWGENSANKVEICKRKRVGWYIGFLAQAYDDEGRRIDKIWKRKESGQVVSLTNPYKATGQTSSGPWNPTSDTVKQKWKMQLSYKYGKYYDGDGGDGPETDGENTIFRNHSYVHPKYSNSNGLYSARSGSYGGTPSRTAQTNDIYDVYMDSGIQFSPIPDARLTSSTEAYNRDEDIKSLISEIVGGTAPKTKGLYSKWTSDGVITSSPLRHQTWSNYYTSSKEVNIDMGYLFGKKFKREQSAQEGSTTMFKYFSYEDFVTMSNGTVSYLSLTGKWHLERVGSRLVRRYSSYGTTESDNQIGWEIGEKTSGASADPILKTTGSKSIVCDALNPMTDAYCQSYGDIAYFNTLDSILSIFSDIGITTKIAFQWQVKEDHTYVQNTSSSFSSGNVYEKDGNTNNYIKLTSQPSDWASNYESYYRKSNAAQNWRNINKDELYRGPIFDMRISSITDEMIGILDGDTEEIKTEKKNTYFGNIFGKVTEIFSGVQNDPDSYFGGSSSLFTPVTNFIKDIKSSINDLREDASDNVIAMVPDITQMPSLRVKYNEQNSGYAYRCIITYTTDGQTDTMYSPNENGVKIYNTVTYG